MKNYKIVVTVFLLISGGLKSQNSMLPEITSAPSVMILELSPSDLNVANNKSSIVFSLVNSFKENGGLPNNYALEITPYWTYPWKNRTYFNFIGINEKTEKQFFFSGLKMTSLSMSFKKNLEINNFENSNNIAVSYGFRSNIFKIESQKKIEIFAKCSNELDELNLKLKDKKIEEKVYNEKRNEIKLANNAAKKIDPLFSVDLASAYSIVFLNNKFQERQFGKYGLWITMNSGFYLNKDISADKRGKVNFYAIGRYLKDGTIYNPDSGFSKTENYDIGGKIELVYDKFSIGYEYVHRINPIENTHRSNGIINYEVMPNVVINAAFGRNYGNKDNIISFLGLNWGLDNVKKSLFDEK